MSENRATSVPAIATTVPDRALSLARIEYAFRTVRLVLIGAFACLGILCLGYALRPFAGQRTVISILFSFLADIKFVMAVAFGGASCGWAVVERMLRRRKTEQLQGRIIELEKRIDPDRTSSELTPQGTTNPKDR